MPKTTIIPMNDNVLVDVKAEEANVSDGIILPEKRVRKEVRGVIIALGGTARQVNPELRCGAVLLLPQHVGIPIHHDGKEYKIVKAEDIIARLETHADDAETPS